MDESPEEILKRLEELRCWQGMQQQKLLSKQLSRSELCSMEQQKLCEMFGLSITSTVSNLSISGHTEQQINHSLTNQCDMDTNNVPLTPQKQFRVETPINNFSLDELESYGKENQNQLNADVEDKPKKSFLKRGQGLTNRFKIHPEKLRIENLPKYKFANSHKKSKFFRDNNQPCKTKPIDAPKATKTIISDLKLIKTDSFKGQINSASKQQHELNKDVHSAQHYGKFIT